MGTTTRLIKSKGSSNEWFSIFPNLRFPELFQQLYRILKKNSHLYVFCDQPTLFVMKPIAEEVGFKFWKFIIWNKEKIGMGYHYRSQHELILFLEKGKRKLNNLSIPDILSFPRIRGGYPAEKPVELLEVLVNQSSIEGDLIIDPFMGSGNVGVACNKLNRNFIGNDISDEAIICAKERLKL